MDKTDSIVISAFAGWVIFWSLMSYTYDPTAQGFFYNLESALAQLIIPGILFGIYKVWKYRKQSKTKKVLDLR